MESSIQIKTILHDAVSDGPTQLGTHAECGGAVMMTQFKSGKDQYCVKCGKFGADNTPLANKDQEVLLIAVGYGFESDPYTCSADCTVDPDDAIACRNAIAVAQKLPIKTIDAVLVVSGNEVVHLYGGTEGFGDEDDSVSPQTLDIIGNDESSEQ